MKRQITYLFLLLLIFIHSCKKTNQPNYDESSRNLAEEILVDYMKLPKMNSNISVNGLGSPEFKSLMHKIDSLKKTNYGKNRAEIIKIAEFKILYLFNEKDKAFNKITEFKNPKSDILKNLYTGIYLELENKEQQANLNFKKVFNELKSQRIDESNCLNYNISIILAEMSDFDFKDCHIEFLPKNYFRELRNKDKKEFIKDHFFSSFEI
ncbi:hypothetical protein FHS04_002849 [Mesoflavibacter sabulilitoris]|uniref:hypothetical protein n=1 Tax=Mesoflavibacter zeaxanthinifaciens TaxID=393060 RepID=UPI0016210EBE|nr:hypothetical protein [Mesoflavibacter zeaxanthinifaciens]MBB3125305.1 hypothetical protein [Mesoflavibacter zeaxanthinifaciens subsp. sabulilitoris]